MKSYKYLAKNIGLLTIGSFGTKLLSFFLVPLYTNILTTSEYGVYDLFNTTIGLLIPFLTLNINESILRFSINADSDKKQIFSIGLRYFLTGFILLAIATGINSMLGLILVWKDYGLVFLLLYAFDAMAGIMTSFARGLDKIADISISGVLCSGVIISSNILFLIVFRWGIKGYLVANLIGTIVQSVYLFIRTSAWTYIDLRSIDRDFSKEMTSYSKPLIANSVAWWINNASDRYIVTWLCGVAENGIYSVGYKIPSILNLFQTIFNQAWILSAVKEFDPKDKDGFFSKLYNTYNCLMTLLCSGIILLDRPLARLLFAKDFYEAWRYVPFLTIAIVFGAMSGYIGGIFSAVKNSKVFACSTVIGAVTNFLLNITLVRAIGPLGAAVATAVSYMVVWCVRLINMRKYVKLRLRLVRDVLAYAILNMQSALLIWKAGTSIYLYELTFVLIMIVLFRSEIKDVAKKYQEKFFKDKRKDL